MKLGILGGTFDPVHNAHLAMARAALAHLKLDKVLFMPTGNQKYRNPAAASGEHRVAMLRLALDDPRFAIDARELAPDFSGFTVDTLETLRKDHPQDELVLLMGADQFAKLDTWHAPEKVRALADVGGGNGRLRERNGLRGSLHARPREHRDAGERAKAGQALDAMLPAAVANYISRQRLYS